MRLPLKVWIGLGLALGFAPGLAVDGHGRSSSRAMPPAATPLHDTAEASRILRRQPACFVPNVGQWQHPARFVQHGHSMSMFLEDGGWVLNLRKPQKTRMTGAAHVGLGAGGRFDPRGGGYTEEGRAMRHAALRMSFVAASAGARLIGEQELPGHHNYFLGNDPSRWRTGVSRYAAVRYLDLYPGIDLRLHHTCHYLEYDLILQPGTDLSSVAVQVEGALGMRLCRDGALVIETPLGPMRQPKPETWERLAGGRRRPVECHYRILGDGRFGFVAPTRNRDHTLVVDPGLLWSTLVGGGDLDFAYAVGADATGSVTVAGMTMSANHPTTAGAHNRALARSRFYVAGFDAFVSRFDPRRVGAAQLIYSTYLGGTGPWDQVTALAVDDNGLVTVAGITDSNEFPTTPGAYIPAPLPADRFSASFVRGRNDAFITQLDPARAGAAQLVYSTLLGGALGGDGIWAVDVNTAGLVTVGGSTSARDYPTTAGAYDRSYNGHAGQWIVGTGDAFVSQIDPSLAGKAQLVYSTLLGGTATEIILSLEYDLLGNLSVGGVTNSGNYPATQGARDRTLNGRFDGFVSQLDLSKTGAAQLAYSTYLGGDGDDRINGLAVDRLGVVTVAGYTKSRNFPTTAGALATTYGGGFTDAFLSRLNPRARPVAQLVYSSYLGGSGDDNAVALRMDEGGVVTVAGHTTSSNYPTTANAYLRSFQGVFDIFVSRLDPTRMRAGQLVYSTYLGGPGTEIVTALAVDPSGVAAVAGYHDVTTKVTYPMTQGAYGLAVKGGFLDALVSLVDMGVGMWGDLHQLSLRRAGTQTLRLSAGRGHAGRDYWVLGSASGTRPGISLGGLQIPLNLDAYTGFTIANANSSVLKNTRGKLDANGEAMASFHVPGPVPAAVDVTLHHAFVLHDAAGRLLMASNAVPLWLRK